MFEKTENKERSENNNSGERSSYSSRPSRPGGFRSGGSGGFKGRKYGSNNRNFDSSQSREPRESREPRVNPNDEITAEQVEACGFNTFGLDTNLVKSLVRMGFNSPTTIQTDVMQDALNDRDILASSKTGSGKTLAFCVPLINKIIKNPQSKALIVTPTREIAAQVAKVVSDICKGLNIFYVLIIGGENMDNQFEKLSRNPSIIIGTPGRINDHLSRKSLKMEEVTTAVLDEADRMLDMGFDVQIEEMFISLPKNSQRLMFSATIPHKIEKLAGKYLKNAKFVTNVNHEDMQMETQNVPQEFVSVTGFNEKCKSLNEALQKRVGSVVIFVKTKKSVEDLVQNIKNDNHSVDFIHGDCRQYARNKVIANFRKKDFRILVATDVVARGLDIPHIEHVINFDMPTNFDEYIHRIGRTNRQSGMDGSILNFINGNDIPVCLEIKKRLKIEMQLPFASRGASSGGRRFGSGSSSFGNRRASSSSSSRPSSFGDRNSGERSFGEKKFGERSSGERNFGERSFGERNSGERNFGEKKFGDSSSSNFRQDRSNSSSSSSGSSFGKKSFDKKPFERRSESKWS